tara:strand:+ start:10971 stop:11732 length:762 start_codon:yes stop_codon:yes gene_type:complete
MKKETKRDRYVVESKMIDRYLDKIGTENALYVDIGCGNLFNLSMEKIDASKKTLFFDCNTEKMKFYERWGKPNFKAIDAMVTPNNVVELIKGNSNEEDFKFLDLDIDGYDFFVLKAILESIPPSIIVAEINEKIPPPVEFTVKYNADYEWRGSHCFGMSISKFYKLMNEFGYDIVRLNFNNVHAIRKDTNHGFETYSDVEAYDVGYKTPRLTGKAEHFYYNKDVDCMLTMSKDEIIDFFNEHFKQHSGSYEIE